ncbi:hypothetical protein EQG49_01245 [Periweissella cryptocerci]|uniref:Uncharacterized protein n=1 Tax=Periweissella cryptocerci TaxID=2506420 RepID=A0A4V1AIE0_9LACO|nr:hypothetical protein [Periweissella cryptocerci]QBO35175.1 hypothetical protein EQG49_01245 [Periweissella cryptocerci]
MMTTEQNTATTFTDSQKHKAKRTAIILGIASLVWMVVVTISGRIGDTGDITLGRTIFDSIMAVSIVSVAFDLVRIYMKTNRKQFRQPMIYLAGFHVVTLIIGIIGAR